MSVEALHALVADTMRPQRRATAAALLSGVAAALVAVLLLGLSGWFIAGAAVAGTAGVAAIQAFNYLLPSAAIRMFAIIRTLARYGERLYGHRAALSALATLRVAIFTRLMAQPPAVMMTCSAGDATARLVQDIDAIEDMIVRKPAFPSAIAAGLAGLSLAALAGPWPLVVLLIILAIQPPLARLLARHFLTGAARRAQEGIGLLKQEMVEYAAASAEIVAYGLEAQIVGKLEARAASIDAKRRTFAGGEALLGAMLTLSGGVAVAAVIAFSGASMLVTALAALAAAASVEAQGGLVLSLSRYPIVGAGFARLANLAGTTAPSAPRHRLTGAKLTFGNIVLREGERLAVTGPSGSGKTSLVEALAGLRPDLSRRICIDDVPVVDCDFADIRPLFALSPQNAQMISGTIADNLRLARPGLSEAQLWEALAVACLDTDVRAMPHGLSSWIGDGGARLSGGQRKRLSVTRALLAGRPWLLLDEPSEGLDLPRNRICFGAWTPGSRHRDAG
jgi:ATP-binding cassette subfamily C protein CydC